MNQSPPRTWMLLTSPHPEGCKTGTQGSFRAVCTWQLDTPSKYPAPCWCFWGEFGLSASNVPNGFHSIAWAQLHMIGTRCLSGIGKKGSLPTTLVLLYYLPLGGFQGKLLPWQGAALACKNRNSPEVFIGVFPKAHTICRPSQCKRFIPPKGNTKSARTPRAFPICKSPHYVNGHLEKLS